MATLNERGALTFRKHVAGQGAMLPNWSKIIETFRSHSGVFALGKQLKILIFRSLFISNRPFAGYFQWTRAQTSRKYVAEQGIVMPDWSKIIETFRSHCSVFALVKEVKSLNFESIFCL